jgi:hypothetical protein
MRLDSVLVIPSLSKQKMIVKKNGPNSEKLLSNTTESMKMKDSNKLKKRLSSSKLKK